MDRAVALAYGWPILADGNVIDPATRHASPATLPPPLELAHGFHETKQGVRFTISEPARREVLQRLLKLNHERYAEEVTQGLHEKKRGGGRVAGGGKKKAASKPAKQEDSLFDGEDDE
jgi:hypothetical protein